MSKERFKVTPAVYLVLIKDEKILLLRRFNTGFEDGNYSLVAGHLDGDETFIEAMVREAKEEAGLLIDPDDLQVVHVQHRKAAPQHERVDVFIRAFTWKGEPRIMEPEKSDDIGWFEINNLPQNTIAYVRKAIESVKNNEFYSEYGWA